MVEKKKKKKIFGFTLLQGARYKIIWRWQRGNSMKLWLENTTNQFFLDFNFLLHM